MMPDLILRQLSRHKARAFLTVLGIAIGILLVTTLSSFSEGIDRTVNAELSYLSGMITITSEGIGFENYQQSELDESLLEELLGISEIERTSGLIVGGVPGIGDVYGATIADLEMFELDVEAAEGRWPEEGEDEVMLGYFYAENRRFGVGDEIEIRNKRYDVVGIMEETGSIEDTGIITSFEPSQEILKQEDSVNIIMAKLNDVDRAEQVAQEIEENYDNVRALSEKDAIREAQDFTGQLGVLTFSLGSIAAIIAGLGIMNVMFMSVRERRREIGVMKALGATNYEVLLQIVLEALFLTLIGAAAGIVLSFLVVFAINGMGQGELAHISPLLIIEVLIFASSIGIIGGILPAREAASLQPAVVLRYE